ncbi:hypothetical protein AVEN_262664-1 [Araneus ventricosus]|uniref:Uncharacterized protein n=1 Tax=Araneus ventricosus TaxID=182803 RepID=A0A4Y2QX89_ARAVE|nr:hypothetical protein AVEN_262664-1 [Araneus ventricosus]
MTYLSGWTEKWNDVECHHAICVEWSVCECLAFSWAFNCTSFHLSQDWFFSIHSSRKMKHIIHGGSKVCFQTRFKVAENYSPSSSLRGRFRVSFLPSTRGLNVGSSFDVPLPSHRGPKLESAHEVLYFKHTLGDIAHPLKNSVQYLETILRDQMNLLLIKASEVPCSKALTHAHLLTLLVNNREKMTRLLHYLFLKDSSELLGKRKYDQFFDVVSSSQFGIRVKTCLEFLKSIDAGDYDPETITNGSDDVALERIAEGSVKPCSYGLFFHEFRPRFALFPIVGTVKNDVSPGLVCASVVSRVMAIDISHVKGGESAQMASVHPFTRALPRDLRNHVQNSTGHSLQVQNLERLEVRQATSRRNKLKPAPYLVAALMTWSPPREVLNVCNLELRACAVVFELDETCSDWSVARYSSLVLLEMT